MVAGVGQKAASAGDIFARIRDAEPGMSRSQRKIAQAILAHPRDFVERPIEDLAPWIGVSAPTITRFCRLVDCAGLRELKLRVMGGMRVGERYLAPSDPPETLAGVIEQSLHRAQAALESTSRQVEPAAIEAALDAILAGGTLYAFGSGGVSSWLVDEVQNRFFRLGVRVVPCRDQVMYTMLSATLGRDDVVLCISLGGGSAPLVSAAGIAREYGARTIAIAPRGSSLAGSVDIALGCDVPDHGDALGPTASRYAFLQLIDILAFAAAVRARPRAMEKLRRLKQQFQVAFDDTLDRPLCD